MSQQDYAFKLLTCMVAAKKLSKRYQIKDLIENLKKDFKNVDSSILEQQKM